MNNTLNHLHKSFLLHQRPYRETSIIADFLTDSDERVSVVCKGVKSSGKKALLLRSILQPLGLMVLNYKGKTSLKSLLNVEPIQQPYRLVNENLYVGLYINEIIIRLFKADINHNNIFSEYKKIISVLSGVSFSSDIEHKIFLEMHLRKFEFKLLSILGYELDFFNETRNGEKIKPDGFYQFKSSEGFSEIKNKAHFEDLKKKKEFLCVVGKYIVALQKQNYKNEDVRVFAKKLSRAALLPHLGPDPIFARQLFKNRK